MNELLIGIAQVMAAAGGAWLAVRVELRWLRADVNRHEKHIETHDARLRELETL